MRPRLRRLQSAKERDFMKDFVQSAARSLTLGIPALALIFAFNAAAPAQNWSGDGGKGMSITILAPEASGLAEAQSYIPALVQGEIVSNFSGYSAIEVLDWEQRDALLVRLLSGSYSDSVSEKAAQEIGNAVPTTHFMQGNITKTGTGYNLRVNVTKAADKKVAASYSKAVTVAELDNLTGIRKASLELLQKLGVALTAKAKAELGGAADDGRVSAQTALAQGVTAQRQGTEVAALSYYFKAAAADPTLMEAMKRSSILNANISSGNMGDNVRNEIQWRKQWLGRLTETEQFIANLNKTASMPYTLMYLTSVKQGKIDFKTETVDVIIATVLRADPGWALPMERTLQAVYDGLKATKKAKEWGLDDWPKRGVTDLKVFGNNFSVDFEMVNGQNKVIGKQTLQTGIAWDDIVVRRVPALKAGAKTVEFKKVNANDITDNLTIRVASVNGADAAAAAKKGILQILAIVNGQKGSFKDKRDGKSYKTVRVGFTNWMAENLNYASDSSWCYRDTASYCAKYGRLYNWDAAMKACPAGWRMPAREDWMGLFQTADFRTLGNKLKSKTGWAQSGNRTDGNGTDGNGTDDFGFSALPGGTKSQYSYGNAGREGRWWMSTEASRTGAFSQSLESDYPDAKESAYEKVRGLSVRCVEE